MLLFAGRQPPGLVPRRDHQVCIVHGLAIEPSAAAVDQPPGLLLRSDQTKFEIRIQNADRFGDRDGWNEGDTVGSTGFVVGLFVGDIVG